MQLLKLVHQVSKTRRSSTSIGQRLIDAVRSDAGVIWIFCLMNKFLKYAGQRRGNGAGNHWRKSKLVAETAHNATFDGINNGTS